LIHAYTALDLSPDDVHATGMREVARINRELEDLGEQAFGTRDRAAILKRLRTDPDLYFRRRDEVEEKARQALAGARRAIPRFFGRLPRAECESSASSRTRRNTRRLRITAPRGGWLAAGTVLHQHVRT